MASRPDKDWRGCIHSDTVANHHSVFAGAIESVWLALTFSPLLSFMALKFLTGSLPSFAECRCCGCLSRFPQLLATIGLAGTACSWCLFGLCILIFTGAYERSRVQGFTHRVAASLESDDHGFAFSHVAFVVRLRTANKNRRYWYCFWSAGTGWSLTTLRSIYGVHRHQSDDRKPRIKPAGLAGA